MAGSSLFALIDDIATLLDDVSVMAKVATKKTAGVLGDDLALNAKQVEGVNADRELPVVFAVAKGSAVNKLILVPTALLISVVVPWAIVPLLMVGGLYLCFEGVEKLAHRFLHRKTVESAHQQHLQAIVDENVDMVAFEQEKIKGAVRTDFILSAEIIVIALGSTAHATLLQQSMVLAIIAVVMTIGVYGLVAAIIKLDDMGLYLTRKPSAAQQLCGRLLLRAAPTLMKFLSVAGTAAMFLVGGGILVHGIPGLHHLLEAVVQHWILSGVWLALGQGIVGVMAGAVALLVVSLAQKIFNKKAA